MHNSGNNGETTVQPTWADSIIAYALAAWALLQTNQTAIMGLLGAVLVIAKIIQEVPKAWRVIFPKKEKPDG